jgi:tRNA pseudouridine38-40 synthase
MTPTARRYFMHLAYDGTAYCGWQRQRNALTVQEILEQALGTLLGSTPVQVTGAGRTDTGVHATNYYAHFEWPNALQTDVIFTRKLNGILPHDIVVYRVFEVAPDMHARFSATSRRYHYKIIPQKNPFMRQWAHQFHRPLNVGLMQEAASNLLHYTDFACFTKSHHNAENTLCTIDFAHWRNEEDVLIFDIQANRFLRNMVRAIVGTLLDVGTGKISMTDFHQVLESGDRKKAGVSVPPQGLYLIDVSYPAGFDQFNIKHPH